MPPGTPMRGGRQVYLSREIFFAKAANWPVFVCLSLKGWSTFGRDLPVRHGWPENIASLSFGSRHCANRKPVPGTVESVVHTVPAPHCQSLANLRESSGMVHDIVMPAGS
jgi:hypothetical protein